MQLRPVLFAVLASFIVAAPGARAQFDVFPAADLVLGAADFTTAPMAANTRNGMNFPFGLAVDPVSGKVFVSISAQNRILRFANSAALVNGADAEAVIGQTSYTTTTSGVTATTLDDPYGIDIDDDGRLWVFDYGNNRVLMYEDAANLSEFGAGADLVLGQPDFVTKTAVVSQTKMSGPTGLHIDDAGNLWVAEFNSHRVVKFANAANLANGATATVVLGQPDFVTGTSGTSDVKMKGPVAVQIDDSGHLWVAEQSNNRVTRFDGANTLTNGAAADAVLGQADFTTGTSGSTAEKFGQPNAFADNFAAAPGLVRSGPMTLFLTGISGNPNPFPTRPIHFATPHVYTGGALLFETRSSAQTTPLLIDSFLSAGYGGGLFNSGEPDALVGDIPAGGFNWTMELHVRRDKTAPVITFTGKPKLKRGKARVTGTVREAGTVATIRLTSSSGQSGTLAANAAVQPYSFAISSRKKGKPITATDASGNRATASRVYRP